MSPTALAASPTLLSASGITIALLVLLLVAAAVLSSRPGSEPLYRKHRGYQLQGLCIGLAASMGVSTFLVRAIFVLLFLLSPGLTFVFYVVGSLFVPWKPPKAPAGVVNA